MSRIAELREKFFPAAKPFVRFDASGVCTSCRGTGRDPMSDIVDWLPCGTCEGKGHRP